MSPLTEEERVRDAMDEWGKKRIRGLRKRDINIDLFTKTDHIIDVIGVRRSGKTSILYLVADSLKEEAVAYMNFEKRTLYPLNVQLLDELLKGMKRHRKAYLFLDEIQNVKGWERWAREVYDKDKGRIKIVVSGSSSRIIRKDVATILTGRHIPLKVFPLSFREFVRFKGGKHAEALLEEYITFGGFPEVVLQDDPLLKREILAAYYDDIIYKDILDKYGIQEKAVLENFVKFLFTNISGYFSYKRGKDYLDTLGIPTSTRTLLKYTSILEEVFLFFFVPIFAKKVREQAKYPKKEYAVDIGLRNIAYSGEDFGRKAENLVFLELQKRGGDINYWRSKEGKEVDFVIRDGHHVRELIQVTWNMEDEMTRAREIQGIVLAAHEFGKGDALIICKDEERTVVTDKVTIRIVPLWKWLLNEKR
ncbi:MAG: ATP-binding protein [Nanoarchaeota archaeon]